MYDIVHIEDGLTDDAKFDDDCEEETEDAVDKTCGCGGRDPDPDGRDDGIKKRFPAITTFEKIFFNQNGRSYS